MAIVYSLGFRPLFEGWFSLVNLVFFPSLAIFLFAISNRLQTVFYLLDYYKLPPSVLTRAISPFHYFYSLDIIIIGFIYTSILIASFGLFYRLFRNIRTNITVRLISRYLVNKYILNLCCIGTRFCRPLNRFGKSRPSSTGRFCTAPLIPPDVFAIIFSSFVLALLLLHLSFCMQMLFEQSLLIQTLPLQANCVQ